MKKYSKLLVLVVLMTSLILASISVSFAQEKTYEVAVLLPGTVEFFSIMRQGIDKAAKEFGLILSMQMRSGMPGNSFLR
jgi:ribose transport system substrate-binding protein